jgi:hypothetical protein
MPKKKPDRYGALAQQNEKVDFTKKLTRPGPKVALENRRLTRKQELFVRELVTKDGQITLTEAAINAGYAPRSAHVRASEMTNPRHSPHVVKAIRDYRNELDQKYGVEYKRHSEGFTAHSGRSLGRRCFFCRSAGRVSKRAGSWGYLRCQVGNPARHHRQHVKRRSHESLEGVESQLCADHR